MLIDKIKNIGSIFNNGKSSSVKSSSPIVSKDNVEISTDAKVKAEIKTLTSQILSNTDSLNANRISEIKEKLANGFYNQPSSEVLTKTAEQLLEQFSEEK
jgi:anti-sigma28 factor (negative regulator of flagellin synthesis)